MILVGWIVIFMCLVGLVALVLYARQRNFYTKVDTPSASHNSVRNASCATCRKNIDDDHCVAGGWYGEGSCKLWAPRNQHP